MTSKIWSIVPTVALMLGACTLNTKNLGEPNFDSSTDSDGETDEGVDATSSSSSAPATTGPGQTSSSSSATEPEQTSSSSSATEQTSSSSSATEPEATSSSSSATEPEQTASSSATEPEQTSSSSSAGSDTDQTSTSSTSGGETTGAPVVCEEAPLQGVDRSCEADEDCVVVFHQTDCCGTFDAFGINAQSQAAYDEAEAPCMFEPNCDCAPEATDAEDGEATADNAKIVAVCVDNQCRSEVP